MNSPGERRRQRAVCVLGMHRSGTSVIARALNLHGVFLGERGDLLPAGDDNPSGFWERRDVLDLHERILRELGRRWDTNLPLPEGWHLPYREKKGGSGLVSLIEDQFSKHCLWGWKDPRTSLLYPLWRDALHELGIECSSVIVFRNPLDVAASLKKRNGYSLGKSLGIWFNYNTSALMSTEGEARVFVSFEDFLQDRETELARCFHLLGLPWPEDHTRAKEKLESFVSRDLCSSESSLADLKNAKVPLPVVELYEMLKSASKHSAGIANAPE